MEFDFAGEHLSDEFGGYMNGGAQTGRLAAVTAIRRIKRNKGQELRDTKLRSKEVVSDEEKVRERRRSGSEQSSNKPLQRGTQLSPLTYKHGCKSGFSNILPDMFNRHYSVSRLENQPNILVALAALTTTCTTIPEYQQESAAYDPWSTWFVIAHFLRHPVVLTDWLSAITALGVDSLPSLANLSRSAWLSFCQTPSIRHKRK